MAKIRHPDVTGLHIRVVLSGGAIVGPGRAGLLEAIRDEGSISAAARKLGMSYRKAWTLVEDTSRGLGQPVVTSVVGGGQGGGAALTEAGSEVVRLYRLIETKAAAAITAEYESLEALARNTVPA